jgi:TolB-like protein/Tfp pilus assembly protein PilF
MALVAELKRRKVFRVAAAYLVVGWMVVEAAGLMFPVFGAPDWALRAFILVVLLGFPLALVLAWIFDVTPEGVSVTDGARSYRLLAALPLLLAMLAVGWFARGPGDGDPPVAGAPSVADRSIAVLAFADLSAEQDQEHFADGIAEEILHALARIRDLRVAGRTSSFHYKGRNEDLRQVGAALGVAHVLEGSVRSQGSRLRITAQLIRVADGFHLWSETYDAELADVFAVQERIARAIARELQVLLRAEEAARLSHTATTSGEGYGLFLRATAVYNQRTQRKMQEAVGWLEEALRLDPSFARAHSRLAMVAALAGTSVQGGPSLAERHARLALALDSTLAEPHAVLSLLYRGERRLLESMVEVERAVALDPEDATVRLIYAQNLVMLGYSARGNEELDRTLAIDMLPNALHWRGLQHLVAGELAKAEALFRHADELGLSWASAGMLELARFRRDTAAVAALLHAEESSECGGRGPDVVPRSIRLGGAGTPAEREAFIAIAERCLASRPMPAWVALYLVQVGAPELAVASLLEPPGEQVVRAAGPRITNEARWWILVWSPGYREARIVPGFSRLLREAGLAEAWERFGPPDLCRRGPDGGYACS